MPNLTVRGLNSLPTDRCLVMGVLNITPDSFSDGGFWLDPRTAIARGRRLIAEGADILDIGGESTRPGAERVCEQEQLRRILPVIDGLRDAGCVLSVDTMSSRVAKAALAAGATIVNDVSGGRADPGMFETVASALAPYVLMHWRGHSRDMNSRAVYDDVVKDVRAELADRLEAYVSAGGEPERVILDPGLGFAKNADHNWKVLAGLDEFASLGRPLLIAGARKRFLGELLAHHHRPDHPVGRDDSTAALTAIAALHGAWGVRVHDVRPNADAVRVAAAVRAGGLR